jgi:signal transduction histidine kinase
VILESRALIDEAAQVQAREQVTRLKEDFLSAAAHDLKTPLTTLVAQTELLERRALRDPGAPADLAGLQKIKKEAHRLSRLVLELLDAARAEQGKLVGEREEVDLVAFARDVCARHQSERHRCLVEAAGPVIGLYDPNRIGQLVENLVENAVKYSPEGGTVLVKAWREDDWNRLSVIDCGIGIPKEDLPYVFERFHRGTNVDDRRFAGMGLGLYICRGIAEQHGGRIWVESAAEPSPRSRHPGLGPAGDGTTGSSRNLGSIGSKNDGGTDNGIGGDASNAGACIERGSTFHVALPIAARVAEDATADEGQRGGERPLEA